MSPHSTGGRANAKGKTSKRLTNNLMEKLAIHFPTRPAQADHEIAPEPPGRVEIVLGTVPPKNSIVVRRALLWEPSESDEFFRVRAIQYEVIIVLGIQTLMPVVYVDFIEDASPGKTLVYQSNREKPRRFGKGRTP